MLSGYVLTADGDTALDMIGVESVRYAEPLRPLNHSVSRYGRKAMVMFNANGTPMGQMGRLVTDTHSDRLAEIEERLADYEKRVRTGFHEAGYQSCIRDLSYLITELKKAREERDDLNPGSPLSPRRNA